MMKFCKIFLQTTEEKNKAAKILFYKQNEILKLTINQGTLDSDLVTLARENQKKNFIDFLEFMIKITSISSTKKNFKHFQKRF